MGSEVSGHIQQDHAAWATEWLKRNDFPDWEVVIASERQIMIDYDTVGSDMELPEQFFTTLGILGQVYVPEGEAPTVMHWERFASKGGNTHVIVTLPYDLNVTRRVAWQAAFGSDPKREALCLPSIARNDLNPVLLYMKKKPQLALPEPTPQLLLTAGVD